MSAIDPRERQLVGAHVVARRLGVAPSTVRRLAAQGELGAFRVGRQYRFDLDELLGSRPMPHPASYVRSEREAA